MTNPIGALLAEDERFTHQVTDTFASVGTSDPSWTEKVCAMAMARDGSLQIGFGLASTPTATSWTGTPLSPAVRSSSRSARAVASRRWRQARR